MLACSASPFHDVHKHFSSACNSRSGLEGHEANRAADMVGQRAEYLRLLREREKAAGLSGDPDTDAFLKASALQGKRHSVVTEYMLKLLGLDVSTLPSLPCHAVLPLRSLSHLPHFAC